MEVGDWSSTRLMSPLFRQLRELGLETCIAEMEAFGFTILEPGRAAPVERVMQLRDRLLEVAERRTGVKHDLVSGAHGSLEQEPPLKHQYQMYYLLFDDPLFAEVAVNPCALAIATYFLGFDCRLSGLSAFVKWQDEEGYGPALGMHIDSPSSLRGVFGGKETHAVNVTWLLTDYTLENGALAIVPGSHREGRYPNSARLEGSSDAVPIEAPAGSLVIWTGNTWHGAFPRTTPGLRLSLAAYYCKSHLFPLEDYRGNVTDDFLAANPKRMAVLIGLAYPVGWDSPVGPQFSKSAHYLAEAAEEAGMQSAFSGASVTTKTDVNS